MGLFHESSSVIPPLSPHDISHRPVVEILLHFRNQRKHRVRLESEPLTRAGCYATIVVESTLARLRADTPHPGCFAKRGCNTLKTNDWGSEKRGKRLEETAVMLANGDEENAEGAESVGWSATVTPYSSRNQILSQ
jgi:hypothetical protein